MSYLTSNLCAPLCLLSVLCGKSFVPFSCDMNSAMPLIRVVALAAWLAAPSLHAQEARGHVTGGSASAVTGAVLTVTNVDTGVRFTSASNSAGDYLLPFLLPGKYDLRVTHPGFKEYLQQNIEVRVAATVTVDAKLELGDSTQSITVASGGPLLDIATATVGPVTTPGVSTTNLLLATQTSTGAGNFSLNGSANTGNHFSIDGIANTQGGALAYTPPPDAVQEVRMMTASFSPSAGFTTGAIMNVTLKSGTNALHGNALYFIQNPKLDSNDYFSNLAGLPRLGTRQNRYGITAPVRW